MPRFRMNVEVEVFAEDAADALYWIDTEVLPIAAGDTPIMSMSYRGDSITLADEDDACNTCGGTGRWQTTFEDSPTTLTDLGPCPDCTQI